MRPSSGHACTPRRSALFARACVLPLALACAGLPSAEPPAPNPAAEAAAKAAAEAKARAAELEGQLRNFYLLLGRLSPKENEARARIAAAIGTLAAGKTPEGWAKTLAARHASLLRNLESLVSPSSSAALAGLLTADLDAARRETVSFIQGNQYGSKESQKKVDELVEKVRTLWNGALALALDKNPLLRKAIAEVKEVEGYLALFPAEGLPKAWDEKTCTANFNAAARVTWSKPDWLEIERYNQGRTYLDEQEKLHLQVLNEYRMMLGLPPFESDARLWAAARGHCRDMRELKFFDHNSPAPGKRSPGDRCLLEGYRGWGAENIYFGSLSGADAFRAWYGSPGHHKNMLSKNKQIGAGRSEGHWTQVFGMEGYFHHGRGNRPPLLQFREKAAEAEKIPTFKAHFELAQFAQGLRLLPQAKEQLQAALNIEPENANAKSALVAVEAELARAPAGGVKRK